MKKDMKKEFIDGKQSNGLKYEFSLIRKEFKKLKIHGDFYNPSKCPFEKCKWFVNLSDRSTGKTTNWLLFGMVMNKLYGTTIQYIRQTDEMITPRNSKNLFDTILSCNYVEKITDGKYNTIVYKARRWFYAVADSDGKIIEQSEKHFMFMLSIDNAENYKSSYNAPYGDLIIFDEFIGKYYYRNEFVRFNDLLKTIIRDRQSPIIVLLANTIEKNSQYFNELEIYTTVQNMKQGDCEILTSERGTNIYVEILESGIKKQKARKKVNKLFFGWKNPLISSITGDDWAIDNYPHTPQLSSDVVLKKYYLEFNNNLVALDVLHCEEIGLYVSVHKATKTYDDSIIFTIGEINDNRKRYRFGYTMNDKKIWELYKRNKFFYSSNDLGSLIENYVKQSLQM